MNDTHAGEISNAATPVEEISISAEKSNLGGVLDAGDERHLAEIAAQVWYSQTEGQFTSRASYAYGFEDGRALLRERIEALAIYLDGLPELRGFSAAEKVRALLSEREG